MTDSKYFSLHIHSSRAASPLFSLFSRFLSVVLALPPIFGLSPSEFSQEGLYLLNSFSAPILTSFFWPLLSFSYLLFQKISVTLLFLFCFLIGLPPTFSRLEFDIEFSLSLVFSLVSSIIYFTCSIL